MADLWRAMTEPLWDWVAAFLSIAVLCGLAAGLGHGLRGIVRIVRRDG